MAYVKILLGRVNNNGTISEVAFYIGNGTPPSSGLNKGDLLYDTDVNTIYFAKSTTAFGSQLSVDSILSAGGIYINNGILALGNGTGSHYVTSSATTGNQIVLIPDGAGHTFVLDGLAQTLSNKTLVAPVLVTTSGTGVVKIGEWASSSAYGAIGMAGDISANGFNFLSSPGDTNLYIRRPSGKAIIISEAGDTQMTLPAGAPFNNVPALVGSSTDPPAASSMGKVNRTAQNASIAAFNLTNSCPAGLYRISYFLRCTTSDVTAGTISFSTTYTDSVGATTEISATAALTSTANRANGAFVVDLASGNIQGLTTLTGTAGTSQYKVRVRVEHLG